MDVYASLVTPHNTLITHCRWSFTVTRCPYTIFTDSQEWAAVNLPLHVQHTNALHKHFNSMKCDYSTRQKKREHVVHFRNTMPEAWRYKNISHIKENCSGRSIRKNKFRKSDTRFQNEAFKSSLKVQIRWENRTFVAFWAHLKAIILLKDADVHEEQ